MLDIFFEKENKKADAGVKLGRVSGFSKPGFRVFGFFKKKKKKWNLKKKKTKNPNFWVV